MGWASVEGVEKEVGGVQRRVRQHQSAGCPHHHGRDHPPPDSGIVLRPLVTALPPGPHRLISERDHPGQPTLWEPVFLSTIECQWGEVGTDIDVHGTAVVYYSSVFSLPGSSLEYARGIYRTPSSLLPQRKRGDSQTKHQVKRLTALRRGTQWFIPRDILVVFANCYDPKTGKIRLML